MNHIIKLMRPHQYIKNIFIFLPIFFALKITDSELLFGAIMAFIAFSITASAIYIFNDYLDIEDDKKHPKKKDRPLASGKVSKQVARVLIVLFGVCGVVAMFYINTDAFYILIFYLLLNIAYTIKLKQVAILDVSIIAIGFVLRLFVGSFVSGVELSMWIVLMTFLLALFLALAKRRDDVLIFINTGKKMRSVVDGYNLKFLDGSMIMMASVVIVSYTLYTVSAEVIDRVNSHNLYFTVLFVILGVLRYLQISFVEENSGSPTRVLLTDKFLLFIVIGWIVSFFWILY